MMTCCIIDDEPHAITVLKKYIARTNLLSLVFFETDPVSALRRLVALQRPPDIIFCDIAMPELSGMEVGALVPSESQLIYITAHQQYAIEAYKRNAVDYLTKPIFYEPFLESIHRCHQRKAAKLETSKSQVTRSASFLIPTNTVKGSYVNIMFDSLIYIKACGNYLYFYSEGQAAPHESYMRFRKIEAIMDHQRFIRVHRSFIVNVAYIAEISMGNLHLIGTSQTIELSREYRKSLKAFLGDRLL